MSGLTGLDLVKIRWLNTVSVGFRFDVIMADPPWVCMPRYLTLCFSDLIVQVGLGVLTLFGLIVFKDIHMSLPYGTMTDVSFFLFLNLHFLAGSKRLACSSF